MLIIRDNQMDAMRQEAVKGFERRMVQHLNEFFPRECRRAGDERVRAAISQGIARAAKYAITSEIDVARYIDLSVVLGLDFDAGKRHPWAAEILKNSNLKPGAKLQLIFDRVKRMRQEQS